MIATVAQLLAYLEDPNPQLEVDRPTLAIVVRSLLATHEPRRLWHRVFATSYELCKDYDQAMETADNAVADGKERFP